MLDYARYIPGKEVLIIFYDEFDNNELIISAKQICATYQINIIILSSLIDLECFIPDSEYTIIHAILRINSPFSTDLFDLLTTLKFGRHTSCSIAFSYKDNKHANEFVSAINKLKNNTDDNLNIMRPDGWVSNRWSVSTMKLLDNIICDTIRVKYTVIVKNSQPICYRLSKEEKQFFLEAAILFSKYHMYHRSPTDGYFAIRSRNGFYITCTKTLKNYAFDFRRIAEVISYDEDTNTMTYSGQYLPSSDSVEAAILFSKIPTLSSIIHTHDSVRFTRNPFLKNCGSVEQHPYGESCLGHALVNSYKHHKFPLIIMREHGEIFLGDRDSAIAVMKEYLNDYSAK